MIAEAAASRGSAAQRPADSLLCALSGLSILGIALMPPPQWLDAPDATARRQLIKGKTR
jgi:hypothetical protein